MANEPLPDMKTLTQILDLVTGKDVEASLKLLTGISRYATKLEEALKDACRNITDLNDSRAKAEARVGVLETDLEALQSLYQAACDRIAQQSELLSRRAERDDATPQA